MKAESLYTKDGLEVQGPLLITPKVFEDSRGFFFESWNEAKWNELLGNHGQKASQFVQDNHSCSSAGVVRGLHYQAYPNPQAKLLRCIQGEIFDVAVDIRFNSPSFGKWVGALLSAKNKKQLWVPIGFAHGFLAMSDNAEVLYKTTDFWKPDQERSIHWADEFLSIDWQVCDSEVHASDKDDKAPRMSQIAKGDFFK